MNRSRADIQIGDLAAPRPTTGAPELAVVIPTLNERDNVGPLIERLESALGGLRWEAVFVDDDSRDGTAALLREIGRSKPYIRVLQRIGRRGLTSACIEGMMASAAPYLAVIDADLQHDETILPVMLRKLRDEGLDLVVASRNLEQDGMGEFPEARVRLSEAGKRLSRFVARAELSDPMSGYFLLDRRFLDEVADRMSAISFKVLVDMVSSSKRPVRFGEVPYRFRQRLHGESKLDPNTLVEYLVLIVHKVIGGRVPVRFVLFSIVGSVGVLIHLIALSIAIALYNATFSQAQLIATSIAMLSNFLLNNEFTFRERKLRGPALITGGVTYFAVCAAGGVSSLALGLYLNGYGVPWWAAGAAGTIIAAVWNFGVTSVFTWPEKRSRF